MDSSCVNGTKYIYYSEGEKCVIYEGLNLIEEGINLNSEDNNDIFNHFYNEDNNLVNYEYQTILGNVYNINFTNNKKDNKKEYFDLNNVIFVTTKREKIECVEEIENIKEHFNLEVIILAVVFIVVIGFCIYYLYKYRKMKKDYILLEEEI